MSPSEFQNNYVRAELIGDAGFVESYWAKQNLILASQWLGAGDPGDNFLNHPIIRHTMFLDSPSDEIRNGQAQFLVDFWGFDVTVGRAAAGYFNPPLRRFRTREGTFLTSHNTVHHLHHMAQWEFSTGQWLEDQDVIVEWGGGYGNMARLARMINPDITYIIIDTPVFSCLQKHYLGDEAELVFRSDIQQFEKGKTHLMPVGLITQVNDDIWEGTDLFVSTWALSESTESAIEWVTGDKVFRQARHHLLAHTPETPDFPDASTMIKSISNRPGLIQTPVPYIPGSYYAFS